METSKDLIETKPITGIYHVSNLGKQIAIKIKPFGNFAWLSENYLGLIVTTDEQKSTISILFECDIIYASTHINLEHNYEISVAQSGDCIKLINSIGNNLFRYDFSDFMVISEEEMDTINDENLKEITKQLHLLPRVYDLQISIL
jgi:hypothetical protein